MTGVIAPIVFVCGPLTAATKGQKVDPKVRRFLELIYRALDEAEMQVRAAHPEEGWGQDEPAPDVVAKRDWDWMSTCQATVIVLGTPEQPVWRTDGTFIELGWATALDKPRVLVGDPQAYRSPLVRGVPSLPGSLRVLRPAEVQASPASLTRELEAMLGERDARPVAPS